MLLKKKFVLFLTIIAFAVGVVPGATSRENATVDWKDVVEANSPKVRIRVLSNKSVVRIESANLKVDGHWTAPNSNISYHRIGQTALWIRDGSILAETGVEEPLRVSGSKMLINETHVPRNITLETRSDGKIDVFAELPLESYVEGVLAGEMPASWPMESLKAQAVAARSYLLALRRISKHRDFDVDSSQFDQVFRAVESLPRQARDQVKRAVEESQGLILRSDEEYPVQAYFHSDCGGVSERASAIWGKGARAGNSKKHVACPFNPGHSWTLSISKSKLAKMFGLKALAKIFVSKMTDSGRATELNAVSVTGFVREVTSGRLRKVLGYNDLRSTLFEIVESGNNIEFRGRGFGHGVGLCQWGSKVMAENSKNFIEILKFYYPKARIVPISRGIQVGQNK